MEGHAREGSDGTAGVGEKIQVGGEWGGGVLVLSKLVLPFCY